MLDNIHGTGEGKNQWGQQEFSVLEGQRLTWVGDCTQGTGCLQSLSLNHSGVSRSDLVPSKNWETLQQNVHYFPSVVPDTSAQLSTDMRALG